MSLIPYWIEANYIFLRTSHFFSLSSSLPFPQQQVMAPHTPQPAGSRSQLSRTTGTSSNWPPAETRSNADTSQSTVKLPMLPPKIWSRMHIQNATWNWKQPEYEAACDQMWVASYPGRQLSDNRRMYDWCTSRATWPIFRFLQWETSMVLTGICPHSPPNWTSWCCHFWDSDQWISW